MKKNVVADFKPLFTTAKAPELETYYCLMYYNHRNKMPYFE